MHLPANCLTSVSYGLDLVKANNILYQSWVIKSSFFTLAKQEMI